MTEYVRKAEKQDISRIAEILVFTKRMNYRSIFHNDAFSFGKLQVLSVAEDYFTDETLLGRTYVYDDEFVKGLIEIFNGEIKTFYVDGFFQEQGIGTELIRFALEEHGCNFVWVLEKNLRAISFYQRSGLYFAGERKLLEGTPEYLIKLNK